MVFERGCQPRAARQRPKHTRAERDRWARAAETIRRRARGGRGSIILRLTRPGRRRPPPPGPPAPLRPGSGREAPRHGGPDGSAPHGQPRRRSRAAGRRTPPRPRPRPRFLQGRPETLGGGGAAPGRADAQRPRPAPRAGARTGARDARRAHQAALLPSRPRPAL